ncbi:siderophore-interacting protein [Microbacterium esteraromaticum]|uniref:siderophore-interacting protein n=1 Tax=Microbacterium esteraromaticum TaxID=57043 RepID=UPI001A8CF239|nr:siderophore-interacting protein [Microbacterium esteraromaticum]MBN8425315.1 siderophore-interacting protein [Microbacterium esteraromaticum]
MARSLRPLDVFPITTRTLDVLRVADVTPGMRRVTLGGAQLAAHTAASGFPVAAFRSDGFDDEFKMVLPHPAAPEPVGPVQADGVLTWPRGDEHLLFRTYTVRRWDADAGEIDVDFVLHGVGAASSWARRVQPGERVQIAGPKSSAPHPVGADWTLVAGDETALPAIARWLENWPTGAPGQVFIEIGEPSHRQDLPVPDGVRVTWLSRDGAEPGTTSLLLDALRTAEWWDGVVFAWVAGEALTLAPIRRWLRQQKGLPKEQVEVTGYWRRQEVVVSEQDASTPDLEATTDADEQFHELSEVLPAFALRVAATIGLAEALAARPLTVAEAADACAAHPVGLGKLLRYLVALGLAEGEGDQYRLTDLGRQLENEENAEDLDLRGIHARRELGGALALLAAVTTGRGDHARWFGVDHGEHVAADPALNRQALEFADDDAGYYADALARASAFDGARTVAVHGRAAAAIAHALVDRRDALEAIVVGAPSELEVLQTLHPPRERVHYAAGSALAAHEHDADAVLLSFVLGALPASDAVHVLRQAADGPSGRRRVLVFGRLLDEGRAGEHDYEDDLVEFALTGGGTRTLGEHRALFADAGLSIVEQSTVGWGDTLFTLRVAE